MTSRFRNTLRLFLILGAFIVGVWIPLRVVGLAPPPFVEMAFDLLISLVALCGLYLSFKDTGDDALSFKSWLTLPRFLDLVCTLPFSLFILIFLGETWNSLLILNLLIVRHVTQIRKLMDEYDNLQPITYRLVPILLSLPLLIHLISCGWIALGSGTAGTDPDPVLTYVKALYWAFTTLSTVGYGDISAKTPPQMLYACGVQVVGVGVFGYIVSNVASLLARSDAAREHHMDNLDKIDTFIRLHQIPDELRSHIRAYYHYVWIHKKGYQDKSILSDLPAQLKSELLFHINRDMIEKISFLKDAERDLLNDLMAELRPKIFAPGERIFRIDETGDALYFIQSGQVEILGRDATRIAVLGDGSCFGETSLISDRPRNATARALTFCDVYCLSKSSFSRVTAAYPHFLNHLREISEKRQSA